jgi:predicted negative regulator of RcsB-dependent stress response
MKHLIVLLILASLGWYGYGRFQQASRKAQIEAAYSTEVPSERPSVRPDRPVISKTYTCAGRTYCSQMTSCEEATWFLKNCPGTKMDGNNDGIPCERQWCK